MAPCDVTDFHWGQLTSLLVFKSVDGDDELMRHSSLLIASERILGLLDENGCYFE